ncbi:CCR4-NOT core subunit cdc39 [Diatrype stigma]|uniref:General negative regulator of transcription subunit 1 n=1 Tax=Diatrype stigma TaxID=117547 RepID=A0AAN9UID4_9PEZI
MEVFPRYFTRLVAGNAPQIFPGLNRPVANTGNYSLLVNEMSKISHDLDQAGKIAEAIETANEDIFRDFDLSTFMEHFKLDALEKTILALAFKFGSRPDLKTKADAILSTNFPTFVNIISRPDYGDHSDLTPSFIAAIVDRYIQGHPPNFNAPAKAELAHKVRSRWSQPDQAPPIEVLAALDLIRVLGEKPPNALALYIQRTGADFTRDEEICSNYIQNRPPNVQLTQEQVSTALTYTSISITHRHNPSILVAALRRHLPATFSWSTVVDYFDQRDVRISSEQFLRLYNALLPIAKAQDDTAPSFDIQCLWGGVHWENPETQLSFICAFASLTPDELDASTIPNLQPTFTLDEYAQSPPEVQERAAIAVRHPLVSAPALSAIFQVALHSLHASQSIEAKRLFQEVVVPNLDIFIVSAFGVPKPWPTMAIETLASLFDNFLHRRTEHHDFVLDSLWRKDKDWVRQRLVDAHALRPLDLTLIFEHVIKHGWLDELVYLPSGFSYDLAALAHAGGYLDLSQWARNNADRNTDISRSLLQFLIIKANLELQYQRPSEGQPAQRTSTTLQVKTVSTMLQILEDFMPRSPVQELIMVQRLCITSYPRLINYGEGFDDIIDANGKEGNGLPQAAINMMEEHYKKMYGDETEVKIVVQKLEEYKRSRDPLDQDIFACMIHGLFDEYTHFVDYPLEALATTAVLFGGVISHKLISELPLKIGLGMILEAVRDHIPDHSMYKFGLQALMQLFTRFGEWPGFCKQLLQIPGLQGTEAWRKAEEVVRETEEERAHNQNGTISGSLVNSEPLVNGAADSSEVHVVPFSAIKIDPPFPGVAFEDPVVDIKDKIQFGLNNLTDASLQSTFKEIYEVLDERHQQWFASHLVEERAKMQPNYHRVYLDLVKLFEHQGLWSEVLRQTYISVARMLNSESTTQNSTERTYLKFLGAWLGLLTIARDKPIRHRNIAFKQLLIEAHDTKRLLVVVPFVCKVLIQARLSNIFRPPNPWLMDIIHLLIELYHHGDLKLNQKFEIEVLCKDLNLDHKSIEPSRELEDRVQADEVGEIAVPDHLDQYENLSMNGMAGAGPASLSPNALPITIPDLGPHLTIPPVNEMVINAQRLQEIVRTAVTRALQDIIQPVVDRSVTIAAISTQQMIRKDFATEPDDNRLRTSAINMVKATAGSLALVTSKEPLRANITNSMRALASELPTQLPEGTIIMCVNSNLDLACSIIEKHAEERAVPEIEEMMQEELESRRRHRQQRPNEPYVDQGLSRWAMTIPHPYKLSPSLNGLNPEQMAIYEDFARQPRGATQASVSHTASASDATRNIANEVLQDQYSSVPNIPTPAETPQIPHLNPAQLPYSHVHAGLTNGRPSTHPGPGDGRALSDRIQKLLAELERFATECSEDHFRDLPRGNQLQDAADAFTQVVISQESEEFALYAADQICQLLFNQVVTHTPFLESLVHILENLLKIFASFGTTLQDRVQANIYKQPPENILRLPLISALLPTDLLDLHDVDRMLAKALVQREEPYLEFFEQLLDLTLFNDRPVALFADFVRSLQASWEWINEEPELEASQRLKSKFINAGIPTPSGDNVQDGNADRQDLFDYILEEWARLISNENATDKALTAFVKQVRAKQIIATKDDFLVFLRRAIDVSVLHYEQVMLTGGTTADTFTHVDALVKLVSIFAKDSTLELDDPKAGLLPILEAVLAIVTVVLNHHHLTQGEHFCQRVFFRFFSMLMHSMETIFLDVPDTCRKDFLLRLAETFLLLSPQRFPGFAYGWLSLISHRRFLPDLLLMEAKRGWQPFTKILVSLLAYVCEHVKAIDVPDLIKDYYRGTMKFMILLQHDFPDYMAANYMRLAATVPHHCRQLRNIILNSSPRSDAEVAAIDSEVPDSCIAYLKNTGMLEVLDQLIQAGPSEDAIAHLTRAISRNDVSDTTFGNVPLGTDLQLVDDIVTFIGGHAISRFQQDGPLFAPSAPDMATLSLLVHELQPEARYYLLGSIVDRLRYPSPLTEYFTLVLLEIFGHDISDPEEVDIRQQIVRILLERFPGFWPQPIGLVRIMAELVKDDKYMFFDQPFIKADREIAEQFVLLSRGLQQNPLL